MQQNSLKTAYSWKLVLDESKDEVEPVSLATAIPFSLFFSPRLGEMSPCG
jgi:hypothetical protein